jgi:hypothetical protein
MSRRFVLSLAGAAVLGLIATAPAGAQKCTLGWDTPRWVDRSPAACDHVAVDGRVAAPVAAGPLDRVWVARQSGGAWQLASRVGDGLEDGPALPLDGPPSAMVAGPDGALYVAGARTVARWTGSGAPQAIGLPAPVATFSGPGGLPFAQMASAGGGVWVPVTLGLVRIDPDGSRTLFPTVLRPRGGLAAADDGGLWFSAGPALGRFDLGSHAANAFPVSPEADGSVANAPAGASGVWYASRAGSSVNVRSFSGGGDTYGLEAPPLGLAAGPGRYTVWATGGTGNHDWVARISTAGRPGGHPAGLPCAWTAPIACGVNLKPVNPGDVAYFASRSAVAGGLAFDSDGFVHFSEDGYLGRVMAFRGVVPCVHLQPMIGQYRASSCTDGQWSSFVTQRPVARPRVSCLQLTFGYCAGTLRLYYRHTFLGSGAFVVQSYDNPDARVGITKAGYRLIKRHHRLHARAVIESFDFGGLQRRTEWSIVLYPGDHQLDP